MRSLTPGHLPAAGSGQEVSGCPAGPQQAAVLTVCVLGQQVDTGLVISLQKSVDEGAWTDLPALSSWHLQGAPRWPEPSHKQLLRPLGLGLLGLRGKEALSPASSPPAPGPDTLCAFPPASPARPRVGVMLSGVTLPVPAPCIPLASLAPGPGPQPLGVQLVLPKQLGTNTCAPPRVVNSEACGLGSLGTALPWSRPGRAAALATQELLRERLLLCPSATGDRDEVLARVGLGEGGGHGHGPGRASLPGVWPQRWSL